MNAKQLLLAASVAACLTGLTGCSYFNVGEEEFACSGMPDSVYCRSARDVYFATNDGSVPSRVGPEGAYNEECDDCVRSEGSNFNFEADLIEAENAQGNGTQAAAARSNRTGDEVIDNYVTPRLPDQPVPVRTPAVVMRIWIAPWIDRNDDLIAPGYVYTEVEPRRWIYGEDRFRSSMAFAPLRNVDSYSVKTVRAKAPGENSLEKLKEKQNAQRR